MSRATPSAQMAPSPSTQSRPDPENVARTKILLLGMRRSGKSSIQHVLFNDLPPRETLYLETTTQITKHHFDTIIPLEIWDCPGDVTPETLGAPFTQFSTMIFVIDIQDLYQQPIQKLVNFIEAAYRAHSVINLEVFVHKADVLTEEYKIENFRHIQARVLSDLSYENADYETLAINFQLTSIYDHSLHDAFSRVLHKLIDSLPFLEDLLNVFCANSQAAKAFLFDTASRLYVATDASPVDPPTHNLCSDYLRTLNAFGPLYKSISASPPRIRTVPSDLADSPPPSAPASPELHPPPPPLPPAPTSTSNSRFASPLASPHTPARSAQQSPQVTQQPLPVAALVQPPNPARSNTSSTVRPHPAPPSPVPTTHSQSQSNGHGNGAGSGTDGGGGGGVSGGGADGGKPLFYPSAAASLAPTAAGAGTTLTYHLITPQLALLSLIPTGVFAARRGLVEYNVVFFREGVQEICEVEADARRVG